VIIVVIVVVEPEAGIDDNTFAAEGDADLVCTGEGLPTFRAHFWLALDANERSVGKVLTLPFVVAPLG